VKIKIFGNDTCPLCKVALKQVNGLVKDYKGVNLTYYNMETEDGLVEGALNEVTTIPTILLLNKDRVVARWNGEIPQREEVLEKIEQIFVKERNRD
jgi:thiol-disulfide isomerase/thioredoxin